MSLLRRPLPSLVLLALLATAGSVALAAPQQGKRKHSGDDRQGQQQPARQNGHGRSDDAMSDSIRKVERATGGQVLSAERVPYEGRSVNRIKVVDDRGRVRVYTDDPNSSKPRQSNGARPTGQRPTGGKPSRAGSVPTRDDDD